MNKRQSKKAAKKTAARKKVNTSRPFATSLELVKFRENVAKANKRIARLETEGLEPTVLTQLKSAIDGDRIRIPRGKALTAQAYYKLKAITENFLKAKTSKLKAAREGEQKRRENFHNSVISAFRGEIDPTIESKLYYVIGDIDTDTLLKKYSYDEMLFGISELQNTGLSVTTDLVDKVLQNNTEYVIIDELAARGIPTSGTLRDYVEIALQYGIGAAENQWIEDNQEDI